MALIQNYSELNPADVGLCELAEMVVSLPGFKDDPALANQRILMDIQITWYEELAGL